MSDIAHLLHPRTSPVPPQNGRGHTKTALEKTWIAAVYNEATIHGNATKFPMNFFAIKYAEKGKHSHKKG